MDKDFLIETGKRSIENSDRDGPPPVLIAEYEDKRTEMMMLTGAHPFVMVMALVPTLREQHPASLALTVDAYMASGSLGGGDEAAVMEMRARHGNSLQAAFQAGEPLVSECLQILMVDRFTALGVSLPYTRSKRGITWDEPREMDGATIEGRMIEALRMVWS
jgi:hypothetical protein